MKNQRWLALQMLAFALVLALGGVLTTAQDTATVGTFEETDCPFEVGAGAPAPICGYVTVPEEHANPDGPTIRIAVAIYNSGNSEATPLVMAQGGPGGSTLDLFGESAAGVTAIFAAARDVVLIEQRGTLYSEPSLTCPELNDLTLEILDADLSVEEVSERENAAIRACADRLESEGVNFGAFDSVENAADVPLIMDSLGYTGQFNYYGVSYGAMLAQHVLRDHGDRVRAAIIDAVAPLEVNFMTEVGLSAQRAFDEIFAACAASPDCSAAFPDLETVFFDTIESLNAEPATVTITDPETGDERELTLDGNTFLSIVFAATYSFPLQMPNVIYNAADGNFIFIETIGGDLLLDRSMAFAMQASVLCAEDGQEYGPDDIRTEGVNPLVDDVLNTAWSQYPMLCENVFTVEALPASTDEPVTTDVPVLALSGQFDPITPPSYAEGAIVNMSNVYNFTFPNVGHGVLFGGGFCAFELMGAFLNDPTIEPDATCIDAISLNFTVLVQHPSGDFALPIPNGWEDNSEGEISLFVDPETGAEVYGVSTEANEDFQVGVDEALAATLGEGFAGQLVQIDESLPGTPQYIYVTPSEIVLVVASQNDAGTVQANIVIVASQAALQQIVPELNSIILDVQFID